ncbi:MAG: chalcone isomerase family protein [Myxococcales bacterium]|nr:chalcone isomerase family protein [Myxococcales bacterium]
MKRIAITTGILLLLATTARADTLAGVTMPKIIVLRGSAMLLNGLGLREATIFNVDVYVAGLYLKKYSKSASEILDSKDLKYLRMKFVRKVDAGKMRDAWIKGVKKNGGGQHLALVKKLNAYMRDMKKGDEMSFTFEEKGVGVKVKGTSGFIAGAGFARALLAVFIGKHPPNKGLKRGLLGKR